MTEPMIGVFTNEEIFPELLRGKGFRLIDPVPEKGRLHADSFQDIRDQYFDRLGADNSSAPKLILNLSGAKSINRGGVRALTDLEHYVQDTGGELILADVPEKIKPQLLGWAMIELLPQREDRFVLK